MGTVDAPPKELSAEAVRCINDIWDYLERLNKRHIGEAQLMTLKQVIYRDGGVADEATLRNIRMRLKDKWEKSSVTAVKPAPTTYKDGGEGNYDAE